LVRLETAAAAALTLLPWLLRKPGEGLIAAGTVALVVLIGTLPYWLAPVALWPARTARVFDDNLVAPTMRGERSIPLAEIERIWSRSLLPDSVQVEVVGLSTPAAGLLLMFTERVMPGGLRSRLRELAVDPRVRTSARARRYLKVDGAPAGWAVVWLAFRSACLAGAAALVIAGLALIYLTLLVGRAGL
jgi:hypothetical protein